MEARRGAEASEMMRGVRTKDTQATREAGQPVARRQSDFHVMPPALAFQLRGLPESSRSKPYSVYEVIKLIDALEGEAAPFGTGGGGTQYLMPSTIQKLIECGYLRDVTP